MNIPLYGDEYRKLFGNMATLSPSAQDAPNMTVKISAGGFWSFLDGVPAYIEYVGGSSPSITTAPPGSNARWFVVTLNPSGMVVNIAGDSSATPVLPVIPHNRYPIALVYVEDGVTELTNDVIFDARPIFANPVRSHHDLADRTAVASHPTSAITDLDDILATLATLDNLSEGLDTKADADGTDSTTFVMNQSETGIPSSDVTFEVERGDETNVSIMWHEDEQQWQYTNDGATWYNLSAFVNDGTQAIYLKIYDQASAPTLSDESVAIWIDSDDADKVYLAFKPTGAAQVKVALT